MTRNENRSPSKLAIKLSIWSIENQTWLAGQVRIYIYAATALVAFFALAGVISVQTAMMSAFSGGAVVLCLIWTLVQQRKAILLNIREPEVRKRAHKAMVAYLQTVDPELVMPVGYNGVQTDRREECRQCRLS